MTNRIRKVREADLSPEQKAKVEAARAQFQTPEARAEQKQIRERFQREKPSQEDLIKSGEFEGPFRHGDVIAFLSAVARLKTERERRGLTIAEVSERSGLDKAFISRLENGKALNPTITTLWRYAEAIGMQVALAVEALPTGASEAVD